MLLSFFPVTRDWSITVILLIHSTGLEDCANVSAISSSSTYSQKPSVHSRNASDLSGKRIRDWFSQINRQVYDMQTGECKMKTTLAVLFASSTQCRWAHVGDTRVYHFLNNDLKDMTLDHSVPQMAVFSGEITQAEIRQHKNRNKLLRAIGYQTEIEADVSTVIDITRGNHSFRMQLYCISYSFSIFSRIKFFNCNFHLKFFIKCNISYTKCSLTNHFSNNIPFLLLTQNCIWFQLI